MTGTMQERQHTSIDHQKTENVRNGTLHNIV